MSDHLQLLGEIKGIVSQMQATQERQGEKLDRLDDRLRDQETTAARHGAIAGGAITIGLALIVETVKSYVRGKAGGGPS